mgnify:CR=1 FL=1
MPRGCKSVAQSGGRRMNARFNPEKFVKERNEALFSLDEKKIRSFMKEYTRLTPPKNEIVFLAMVYKAICNIADAPPEVKAKAKAWLKEHGFKESLK